MAADPNQPILFDCPGEVGDQWDDDGVHSGIRQIIVVYGDDAMDSIHIDYDNNGIDSIHIEYDNNDGNPSWTELGRNPQNRLRRLQSEPTRRGGNQIAKIRLHYPNEILTSISGRYDTYLRSLTFQSNLKKYGPYGIQRGTPFELPNGNFKIVGFRCRSKSYLDFQRRSKSDLDFQRPSFSCFYCIGVFLSPFRKCVKVGPWGEGKRGVLWDDDRVYSGIHQILVVYDVDVGAISSIHIEYDNNGSRFWLEHGRSTGNKIGKIQLNHPIEFLTSISGSYDARGIRSLTFESNVGEHGTYGIQRGTDFSIKCANRDGQIVGFYGRSDESLRCIGVNLSDLYMADMARLQCVKVGPWGEGERGVLWDDVEDHGGVYSGIRGITVRYHQRAICSICIEYDDHGNPVLSEEHGNNHGRRERRGPHQLEDGEILNSISGRYDARGISELTFGSNLKTVSFTKGLIRGRRRGTYFSIPITDGKIVGFYGWSDEYLRCIGVYLSN